MWNKEEKESLRSLFKHQIARANVPKREAVKHVIERHELLKTAPVSKVLGWIKGQIDNVKKQKYVYMLKL